MRLDSRRFIFVLYYRINNDRRILRVTRLPEDIQGDCQKPSKQTQAAWSRGIWTPATSPGLRLPCVGFRRQKQTAETEDVVDYYT